MAVQTLDEKPLFLGFLEQANAVGQFNQIGTARYSQAEGFRFQLTNNMALFQAGTTGVLCCSAVHDGQIIPMFATGNAGLCGQFGLILDNYTGVDSLIVRPWEDIATKDEPQIIPIADYLHGYLSLAREANEDEWASLPLPGRIRWFYRVIKSMEVAHVIVEMIEAEQGEFDNGTMEVHYMAFRFNDGSVLRLEEDGTIPTVHAGTNGTVSQAQVLTAFDRSTMPTIDTLRQVQ